MKLESTLVFVYGSLRKGMSNSGVMGESTLISEWTTEPDYHLADLGYYPAVIPDGKTAIKGELYAVTSDVWRDIEYLEGYPSFYDRAELETPYGACVMYYLPYDRPEDHVLVRSGDWVEYYPTRYEGRYG